MTNCDCFGTNKLFKVLTQTDHFQVFNGKPTHFLSKHTDKGMMGLTVAKKKIEAWTIETMH